jgi:hypothetical protein
MGSGGWNQVGCSRAAISSAGLLPALVLTAAAGWSTARADTAFLRAAKDSTLFEDPAGALASGSGPAVFAGRINAASQSLRRGLILFDIASNIPPGSSVLGARLSLNLSSTSAGPVTVRLHRVHSDWGEGASVSLGGGGAPAVPGDSTWLHRFYDDVFWMAAGGDFDALPRAEALVDQPGMYTWGQTPEMTSDVQSWLDDPQGAFGWMLIGDESRPQTVKRFDSRESAEEPNRPLLEVEYLPPCLPSPAGPGYWRRRCSVPDAPVPVLACAGSVYAELGLPGIDACSAILFDPPRGCQERALGKLSVLILNLCAGRLQTSCPLVPADAECEATSLGDLLREVADLILVGDCRRASGCAGALD